MLRLLHNPLQRTFLNDPPALHHEDTIGDRHYRTVLSWFTAIVNHTLGPALAVPLAVPGDPPPSLQVIGPHGSDLALLALGKRLESEGLARFRAAPPLQS